MKPYIIGLFVVIAISLTGCRSGQKKENQKSEDIHEHVVGDDHGHDHGHDHDHDHDHSKEQNPPEGEEHDHDHEHDHSKDHDHSEGDGHNHSSEGEDHSDEISFTKAQAALAGLTTETVSLEAFRNVIKTSGQIQVSQGDVTTVAATSNGIVSFINPSIAEGTFIKAGEAIVTVSSKRLLDGDPAVKAKAEYEMVLKEYQRAQELVKDNIISVKEYEQSRLRYETAENIYRAQASEMTANGVKVTSPVSGYIKSRLISQGEYVSVGQPIAVISQNRRLLLRAEVPESRYKDLKAISGANFKPGYDDTVYRLADLNGRLLSFGKSSAEQSFFIPVTFEFDNEGDVIPGSFAEIFLLTTPQQGVISIPVLSITEEQGLYFVYLQVHEEAYRKQEVVLGQNNGERVQILSGLRVGDKVVVRGVYQVKLAAISSVTPEGHTHSH